MSECTTTAGSGRTAVLSTVALTVALAQSGGRAGDRVRLVDQGDARTRVESVQRRGASVQPRPGRHDEHGHRQGGGGRRRSA